MTPCVHHWLILDSGPVQHGVCRLCGDTRTFEPLASQRKNYGRAVVRPARSKT